jgi:hypothetical protein
MLRFDAARRIAANIAKLPEILKALMRVSPFNQPITFSGAEFWPLGFVRTRSSAAPGIRPQQARPPGAVYLQLSA